MSTAIRSLGKLEKVELEMVWPDEAANFTPWLATMDNLRILGNTLGMDLEPEDEEVAVGPFSADILCKNTADGTWVVIENQIRRTDHTHLGQILTYAAGLSAKTMIWVAAKFTEEHRAALDWLNENTVDDVSFFGLEIELWKIGDSPPAPKFNIVCKPNDWSKAVKMQAGGAEGKITPHKQLQFEFWTAFKTYAEEHTKLRPQRPAYQHWLTLSIGRAGFYLNAITSSFNSTSGLASPEVRVELLLNAPLAKEHFIKLQSNQTSIQPKIDLPLTWHNPEESKSCKVFVRRDGDFTDRSKWPELFAWLAKYLKQFTDVLGPIVKQL
jgi:hypothetical protein